MSTLLAKISIVFTTIFLFGTDLIAQQNSIPAPEEVLGFKPGADFKLATYEQSLDYFKKLDEASDQIQLVHVGETSEGRPWYFALISSQKNIQNIDRYREIAQQLAHPKDLTPEEAKRLSKEGKPIVHIDGGLHASEVAGAQHTISLAYELLSSKDNKITKILYWSQSLVKTMHF